MSLASSIVEEAKPAQAGEIGEFLLEAWLEAGPNALGWIGAVKDSINVISSNKFWGSILSDPNRKSFICRDANKVVGFAVIRKITDKEIELAGIIVIQNSLGHGFGSLMIRRAVEWATDSHFERMLVKTELENERAISFYKSKGFLECGKDIEEVDGMKVQVLILSLKLGGRSAQEQSKR